MKTFVVSGASSGIGLQIAKEFLAMPAKVAIIDIKGLPKDLDEHHEHIIFVQGSGANEKDVKDLVQKVQSTWGEIHGLVNNTGIMIRKPMRDLSLEEWNKVIQTNLNSAFLLSRECLPLLEKTEGAIINISSTRAHQSEPNTESYAASKGALVALTHAMAISFGPKIRVNCVSPGWIDSRSPEEQSKEPLKKSDHEQHPVGRVGRTRDISSLVKFLMSDEAGFISGQEFLSDGGMTRKMIYEE